MVAALMILEVRTPFPKMGFWGRYSQLVYFRVPKCPKWRRDFQSDCYRSVLSFGFDGAVSPLAQGRNRSFDRPVVIAPLFRQHADSHKRIERLFRI